MSTFHERLRRCVSRADLTPADVMRWFDRPRSTIDTWLAGRTPWGPQGREAELDLQRLEYAIKHDFRVPATMTRRERITFVVEWRDAIRNHRVSALHSSA